MAPLRHSGRILLASVLLTLAGCAGAPGATLPGSGFTLGPWVRPADVAPSDLASPTPAPDATTTPEPAETPTPGPTGTPGAGGGGSNGGGLAIPTAPAEAVLDGTGGLTMGPDGPLFPLESDRPGSLTLDAVGYVLSTLVVTGGAVPTATHPTPIFGAAAPMGTARVTGTLGAEHAGFTVSYRAAGRMVFLGRTADDDGRFDFGVPLDGIEAGIVAVVEPGDRPQLALQRVTLTSGETTTPDAFTFHAPSGADAAGPVMPPGFAPAAARLSVIDGAVRLDLTAFSTGVVPAYDVPGFTLARIHEAAGPAGGTAVVGAGPGDPEAFLAPPDLRMVPDRLVPGASIGWPAVPGATLYTATLRREGDASLTWEGASAMSAMRLPTALPTGRGPFELTVSAWASADVTIFSVAALRALRLPEGPMRSGSRRSWTVRATLAS